MAVVLTNNAISRLASSLTAGATALSVTAGEGAKFPSVPAGKWFPVTLIKASGALEILRCTARSGDVLTVVRSQEGTAAQAFAVGDRVELRLTSAAIAEFKQTSDISAFMQGMLDDADAATARATLALTAAATTQFLAAQDENTPGGILRVGDGGVNIPMPFTGNLNDLRATGFYNITATNSTNWPFPSSGMLIHNIHGLGTYMAQIAMHASTNEAMIRTKTGVTWTLWAKISLSTDFSVYFKSLFNVPDAAAARTALGIGSLGSIVSLSSRQAATAWVVFNGSGTVSIQDSFNVSSVTDLGVGSYRVNFATPMANANYAVGGSGGIISSSARIISHQNKTTASVEVGNIGIFNAYTTVDSELNSIIIHGGL